MANSRLRFRTTFRITTGEMLGREGTYGECEFVDLGIYYTRIKLLGVCFINGVAEQRLVAEPLGPRTSNSRVSEGAWSRHGQVYIEASRSPTSPRARCSVALEPHVSRGPHPCVSPEETHLVLVRDAGTAEHP